MAVIIPCHRIGKGHRNEHVFIFTIDSCDWHEKGRNRSRNDTVYFHRERNETGRAGAPRKDTIATRRSKRKIGSKNNPRWTGRDCVNSRAEEKRRGVRGVWKGCTRCLSIFQRFDFIIRDVHVVTHDHGHSRITKRSAFVLFPMASIWRTKYSQRATVFRASGLIYIVVAAFNRGPVFRPSSATIFSS